MRDLPVLDNPEEFALLLNVDLLRASEGGALSIQGCYASDIYTYQSASDTEALLRGQETLIVCRLTSGIHRIVSHEE